MIVEITARFECDKCGRRFSIRIDPADSHEENKTVLDIAESTLGGAQLFYEDKKDATNGFGSVGDNGEHFCSNCILTEPQPT